MLPNPIPCRICQSRRATLIGETPNILSRTTVLHHFRCDDCGSVFVGNDIQIDELGEAYGRINEAHYYDQIATATGPKVCRAAAKLSALVAKDAPIIDLGAGNGEFLRGLSDLGFTNLAAHEIPGHGDELRKCTSRVYEDFDYQSVPSGTFAAVTMLDVMEHVPSPRYTLEQVHRILAPGGYVYFHTPTVTPIDRVMHFAMRVPLTRRIGRTWQHGRTSVLHLQNYSVEGIRRVLAAADFEVKELSLRNELSWPVREYVSYYLLERNGLPMWLSSVVSPFVAPLIATDFMNPNKAIVVGLKK